MAIKNGIPAHIDKPCQGALLAIKDALDALNGKWKLPIIIVLMEGPRRFKDLQRTVTGITPKLLSKELKELELNELVIRTVYDTMPVAIEYSLTPYSKTLNPVIHSLSEWGIQHRKHILGKSKESKAVADSHKRIAEPAR
jgi:DNA-binding HxlR family transcriptional regulator